MTNLDNLNDLNSLDPKQVGLSIEKLPNQIEQAWKESSGLHFPDDYRQIKNICIVGMGGSYISPEVVYYLYQRELKIPLVLVPDYNVPAFVDKDSLVVLSSYSGTTEEVLNAAEQAFSAGCKITGIAEGGKLKEWLQEKGLPGYFFTPTNNPSGQPRLGLGYMVTGIIGIFTSLGLVNTSNQDVEGVLSCLGDWNTKLSTKSSVKDNFAKDLAQKLQGNSVGVVAGEFLSGNAHVFANQLNETAKNFSFYYFLPSLNHHLLEGMEHPSALGQSVKFVFLSSDLYSGKIRKRLDITKDILEKQKIEVAIIELQGATKLVQAFEAISISSWTTYYLGLLYGVDPSKIPWVDYFKEQLAKSS